jgi:hypothetical protein
MPLLLRICDQRVHHAAVTERDLAVHALEMERRPKTALRLGLVERGSEHHGESTHNNVKNMTESPRKTKSNDSRSNCKPVNLAQPTKRAL